MLFAGSRASRGWACATFPMSSFTRSGVDQVRPPSGDFVKQMSSPPVLPDQPAKARYATPSVPAAMEAGGPAHAPRDTGGELPRAARAHTRAAAGRPRDGGETARHGT